MKDVFGMSRSYRRLISKTTTARSEKWDKQNANRKIRHANRILADADFGESDTNYLGKRHIEVYDFAGDGKLHWDEEWVRERGSGVYMSKAAGIRKRMSK